MSTRDLHKMTPDELNRIERLSIIAPMDDKELIDLLKDCVRCLMVHVGDTNKALAVIDRHVIHLHSKTSLVTMDYSSIVPREEGEGPPVIHDNDQPKMD